jgi:hypothetical protein
LSYEVATTNPSANTGISVALKVILIQLGTKRTGEFYPVFWPPLPHAKKNGALGSRKYSSLDFTAHEQFPFQAT